MKKKLLVIILDGWGLRDSKEGNAIKMAKTPNFSNYWSSYPHCSIKAAGLAVGLPEGQQGTSEVNHSIIGAGRIIYQDLVRINNSINDGSFFKNQAFLSAMEFAKKNDSCLHIFGLISDGGVHSHNTHVYALLKMAKDNGVSKVFVHAFTDGRDTLPKSGLGYLEELQTKMREIGVGKIATICGRYFAMDRDHNWERVDKAYDLLTKGVGTKFSSVDEAMKSWYAKNITDEFIEPTIIDDSKEALVKENDAVIFANFRTDRPRELTERFLTKGPMNLKFVAMTQYNTEYKDIEVAFSPEEVTNVLGEVISKAGLKQVRITETEKFAHLTFFMNYKRNDPFEGEDRIMLDSFSDIKTHDERPEMRTPNITKEIIQDINNNVHEVIFANICNCDMVGHTGNIPAAIVGIETIDQSLGEIIPAAQKNGYEVIITADHGNAEEMSNERGEMKTSHTTNPVPFILISSTYKSLNREEGEMQDIAPTILRILEIDQPQEMTGKSLV